MSKREKSISGFEQTREADVLAATALETGDTPSLLPKPEDRLGDRLGRYRVEEVLGAGGMGVVYRAYDPELDRHVALKLVLAERFGGGSRERIARFVREAMAMAQLSHPNVVAIYDVGSTAGTVYMAMELFDGRTLKEWIAEDHPWREVVPVMLAAAKGLAAAHRVGLVHRDFKPANVLIRSDGRVGVADFGLARASGADSQAISDRSRNLDDDQLDDALHTNGARSHSSRLDDDITEAGTIVGTPRYMAPEQYRGELTEAVDQFAFCAVLYEAMYGVRALAGDTGLELREAALGGKIQAPPTSRTVPRWLHAIAMRGLARRPGERFASMDDVVAALERGIVPRRVLWLGGLATVAVVGLGSVAWVHAMSDGDCDDADLGDAWNDARREAVTGAFEAGSAGHAAATGARTTVALEHYADQWMAAHAHACEARELGAQQADARLSCLARRRAELGALTKELAEPSDTLIDRALTAVDRLQPVAACEDVDGEAEPDPKAAAARVNASGEVSRARVSLLAGRPDLAHESIGLALAYLRPYPPNQTTIEALYLRGRAYELEDRYADAEQAMQRAFLEGQRSGQDRMAARAAAGVVTLVGREPTRRREAEQWIRHAETSLSRIDGADEEWSDLLDRQAGMLKAAGELQQAAEVRRRALQAAIDAGGPESTNVATLQSNLANDLRGIGDIEGALALHEETLALREQLLGPRHPDIADSLIGIGILHSLRGEPADAETALRRALDIRESVVGPDSPALLPTLGNLANALGSLDKHEEALVVYDRVLTLTESAHPDDGAALATPLGNSAVSLAAVGRVEEAEQRQRRALRLEIDSLGEQHPGVAVSRLMLASRLAEQHRAEEAHEQVELALPVVRKAMGEDHPFVPVALTLRGRMAAELGKRTEARTDLEEAIRRMETGAGDPADLGVARFALARLLLDEDPTRAVALGRAAREAFDSTQSVEPAHERALADWLAEHDPPDADAAQPSGSK